MPDDSYPDGLTPDVLEAIILRAMEDRDFHAVKDALTVMAVRDPHRAEAIHGTIMAGLEIAKRRAERAS